MFPNFLCTMIFSAVVLQWIEQKKNNKELIIIIAIDGLTITLFQEYAELKYLEQNTNILVFVQKYFLW